MQSMQSFSSSDTQHKKIVPILLKILCPYLGVPAKDLQKKTHKSCLCSKTPLQSCRKRNQYSQHSVCHLVKLFCTAPWNPNLWKTTCRVVLMTHFTTYSCPSHCTTFRSIIVSVIVYIFAYKAISFSVYHPCGNTDP